MPLFSEEEYEAFKPKIPDTIDPRIALQADIETTIKEVLADRRTRDAVLMSVKELRSVKERPHAGIVVPITYGADFKQSKTFSLVKGHAVFGGPGPAYHAPSLFFPYEDHPFCGVPGVFGTPVADAWIAMSPEEMAERLSYCGIWENKIEPTTERVALPITDPQTGQTYDKTKEIGYVTPNIEHFKTIIRGSVMKRIFEGSRDYRWDFFVAEGEKDETRMEHLHAGIPLLANLRGYKTK